MFLTSLAKTKITDLLLIILIIQISFSLPLVKRF